MVVYDLREPIRFCPWEGSAGELFNDPESWKKHKVPLDVPDEGRYLDPLSPIREVAEAKYRRYCLLSEDLVEDTTKPVELNDAREAVKHGGVCICFLNRRFVCLNGAARLYEWVVPGLDLRPTQDAPQRCHAEPADVWGDFFLSAASPIVATLDAVYSKRISKTWEHPYGDEGHTIPMHDGKSYEPGQVQPILVNRVGKADALMIREGKGAVFLLPEFRDNAAAAVRLATEVWPRLTRRDSKGPTLSGAVAAKEWLREDKPAAPQRGEKEAAVLKSSQIRDVSERLARFEASWDFMIEVLYWFGKRPRGEEESYPFGASAPCKRVREIGWEPAVVDHAVTALATAWPGPKADDAAYDAYRSERYQAGREVVQAVRRLLVEEVLPSLAGKAPDAPAVPWELIADGASKGLSRDLLSEYKAAMAAWVADVRKALLSQTVTPALASGGMAVDRGEGAPGPAPPTGKEPRAGGTHIDGHFTVVIWEGATYKFADQQSVIVKALCEMHLAGDSGLHVSAIAEKCGRPSITFRIQNYFVKKKKGCKAIPHPAWRKLIVMIPKKPGYYRICPDFPREAIHRAIAKPALR